MTTNCPVVAGKGRIKTPARFKFRVAMARNGRKVHVIEDGSISWYRGTFRHLTVTWLCGGHTHLTPINMTGSTITCQGCAGVVRRYLNVPDHEAARMHRVLNQIDWSSIT